MSITPFRHLACLLAFAACLSVSDRLLAQDNTPSDPVDVTTPADPVDGGDDGSTTPISLPVVDPDIDPIIYTTVAPTAPPVVERAFDSGVAGQAYSFQIRASNSPVSYEAQGLPEGLTLNTETGLISGRAALAGNYDVKLSATNFTGKGKGKLTLTVYLQPIAAVTVAKEKDAVLTDKTSTNGTFVVTRNGGDLAETLNVSYTVSGSAIGGVDYKAVTGKVTIKGGKLSRKITVVPLDKSDTGSRAVRVTLKTGTGYALGEQTKARLKVNDEK